MTQTQIRILRVLDDEEYLTPRQIGERATDQNSGAAARSLRKLMDLGLVEQKQIGWWNKKYRIGLYAYRRRKTQRPPRGIDKMITLDRYRQVREDLVQLGFGPEIRWQENVEGPDTAEAFAREVIFVICNSGMQNQVARGIYQDVMAALYSGVSSETCFRHRLKCRAIDTIWRDRQDWFNQYVTAPTQDAALDILGSIDHIGPITKFHLAKNFGLQVCKPDRHLTRLANAEGSTPEELCRRLSKLSGDKIPTVDLVLWKACSLGWGHRLLDGRERNEMPEVLTR